MAVNFLCPFLAVPWVGQQSVIETFSGHTHARIQNVLSRGSNFDNVFFFFFYSFFSSLVNEGREDQNTTISGPSSARQQNAI